MTKAAINTDILRTYTEKLESHPIYSALSGIEDLRIFMEHHIYSVWDFMSLVKSLQNTVAPCTVPWVPPEYKSQYYSNDVKRFIHEIVLEEETDQNDPKHSNDNSSILPTFMSHFELYQNAIKEIKGNTKPSKLFIQQVAKKGITSALQEGSIPEPAKIFVQTTFDFLDTKQPHVIGAAFALGREHIIPSMFRQVLEKIQITEKEAPTFYYYIKRHIDLDGDIHGPLSLKLLEQLCAGDKKKVEEVYETAEKAIKARLSFWDGVLEAIS
jgi:hypothetical protein